MEALASPRVLHFNGCCTFSVEAIRPAQTSVCIWIKVASSSTIQKCKISLPKRDTPSVPQAWTTPAKMDLSNADIAHLQTQWVLLLGVNCDVKFWPHAFCHTLCMSNALPEPSQLKFPITLATGKQEDFSKTQELLAAMSGFILQGITLPKICPNSQKGIFLGCVPHTTQNILWHDIKTTKMEIPPHVLFDKGMNNLPVTEMPPNITHLCCANDGNDFPCCQQKICQQHTSS